VAGTNDVVHNAQAQPNRLPRVGAVIGPDHPPVLGAKAHAARGRATMPRGAQGGQFRGEALDQHWWSSDQCQP
jgi:hypothetical protein